MIGLTVSSLNGKARRINGLAGNPQVPGVNIPPDYAPWWKQVKPRGFNTTVRRNLEPGQLFIDKAEQYPPWPWTPNNDARDLPEAFTGKPLQQLPRRQFTVDFPHTWIDYAQLRPQVGPEMGQQPSGWEPIPQLSAQRAEAMAAAMPSPWVAPERMVYDISGLAGFLGMLGQDEWDSSKLVTSLSTEATDAGTAAAKAGASPGTVTQIINGVVEFGSLAASLYLQKRQIDQIKKADERERRRQALAAQAATVLPADVAARDFGAPTPWYKSPIFIIGAILVGGGILYLIYRSMSAR